MKGDRIEETRQNEPFCAFQTFALPTDRPTNLPTDMTSHRSARTHLKKGFQRSNLSASDIDYQDGNRPRLLP